MRVEGIPSSVPVLLGVFRGSFGCHEGAQDIR
jgi:hypothetical protein